MKHGIFLPPFSELADPRRVAKLAADAEQAGWDGFYLWDHVLAVPGMAVAEAWTTLAAIAMATGTAIHAIHAAAWAHPSCAPAPRRVLTVSMATVITRATSSNNPAINR